MLESAKQKYQDRTDAAALSYGATMISLIGDESKWREEKSQQIAEQTATSILDELKIEDGVTSFSSDIVRRDDEATLKVMVKQKSLFMGVFGYDSFDINVEADVTYHNLKSHKIDIVMVGDVSSSMGPEIDAVQNYMRDIHKDLSSKNQIWWRIHNAVRRKFLKPSTTST